MILADTNVLFSFTVDNDLSNKARALFRMDSSWHTESHALVEMTNVLVRYVRNRKMTDAEALLALGAVEKLVAQQIHAVAHRDAYAMARDLKVSAYDARFLVAARALGVRLTTEDLKLRRSAPSLTQSLDEARAT